MKKSLFPILSLASLLLAHPATSPAQDRLFALEVAQAEPAPPAPPAPPAEPEEPAAPIKPRPAVRVDRIGKSSGGASASSTIESSQNANGNFNYNFKTAFSPSARSDRSLVIRASNTDPKSLTAAEEDLNIMSRLLDKALKRKGEDEMGRSMGISLNLFGRGIRNMEIEGYGAIFLLQVNFPLASPPTRTSEDKVPESTNSAWEETKDELYGQPKVRVHVAAPKIAYDPKRVDDLKESIVEALKNASNIRDLKDGDFVTVVVTAGEENSWMTIRDLNWEGNPFGQNTAGSRKDAAPTPSTLVFRAKKVDIDAAFKGKLSPSEFHKKVSIALY